MESVREYVNRKKQEVELTPGKEKELLDELRRANEEVHRAYQACFDADRKFRLGMSEETQKSLEKALNRLENALARENQLLQECGRRGVNRTRMADVLGKGAARHTQGGY